MFFNGNIFIQSSKAKLIMPSNMPLTTNSTRREKKQNIGQNIEKQGL